MADGRDSTDAAELPQAGGALRGGRLRRAAPLAGLTTRTMGEAAAMALRGKAHR